jgi:hypothetical protein
MVKATSGPGASVLDEQSTIAKSKKATCRHGRMRYTLEESSYE